MEYRLSDRLQRLCDEVSPCGNLADIGCDHGYVSMELVKTGKAAHVLAMDVNEGPLERARENVKAAGLSEQIELRLSDGLHNTMPDEHFDTILIAGMGGRLMTGILADGLHKVAEAARLVLQPQSEIFLIREFLFTHSFSIEREVCLKDRDKFYFIINAVNPAGSGAKAPDPTTLPDPFFFEYSEYLLRNRDEVYREYLSKSLETAKGYLEKAGDRGGKLKEDIEDYTKALTWFT